MKIQIYSLCVPMYMHTCKYNCSCHSYLLCPLLHTAEVESARLATVLQENAVLKSELDMMKHKYKNMMEENRRLRQASVNIVSVVCSRDHSTQEQLVHGASVQHVMYHCVNTCGITRMKYMYGIKWGSVVVVVVDIIVFRVFSDTVSDSNHLLCRCCWFLILSLLSSSFLLFSGLDSKIPS